MTVQQNISKTSFIMLAKTVILLNYICTIEVGQSFVAGDGKGALKFFIPAFVFLLPFSCVILDTLYSSLLRC